MAIKCVFLVALASMSTLAEGNAFLKATPKHYADRVSAEDIQSSLLEEIEGSLGDGISARRIKEIKAVMSPMFVSLPKNKHGNLEHVTVRYVLHRVFVQRHGWSIAGLDTGGEAWNASSPTGILKDQVPAYIENMFEQRLGGHGLGLQDLAVLAATVEHMIHSEAIGRLGSALSVHKLLPTDTLTIPQADEVLDTYMMAYILGEHLSNMTLADAQEGVRQMPEVYLDWPNTQKFTRKVRHDLTNSMAAGPTGGQLSFALMAKIVETVSEQFGQHQNAECKGLKESLMKMEDRKSGRVRLSDFYKGALAGNDGAWQFQESIAYLRTLGALDESNADEPRVMIPNYLYSMTNCIASSDYYSVCCHSECEDLMVHLEKSIAAPEASAKRIFELVSALPSSTVVAPRVLSETLRTRLDKIGSDHGGSVQLHSRLFAQWMHHAYPRECPYPHMSGTTKQDKADDWGEASVADKDELQQFTSVAKYQQTFHPVSQGTEDVHDIMMWSHEEEHLVEPKLAEPSSGLLRNGMMLSALLSVMVALARTVSASSKDTKEEKFMV